MTWQKGNHSSSSRNLNTTEEHAGAFAGLLHVTVHSIKGFRDTAGLMDRADPFVSLQLGNDKQTTSTKDNVISYRVFPSRCSTP